MLSQDYPTDFVINVICFLNLFFSQTLCPPWTGSYFQYTPAEATQVSEPSESTTLSLFLCATKPLDVKN